MSDELILAGETMRLLKISGPTLERLIKTGKLDAIFVAYGADRRARLFSKNKVQALAEERAKTSGKKSAC